jgi:YfiR/HmsC-like
MIKFTSCGLCKLNSLAFGLLLSACLIFYTPPSSAQIFKTAPLTQEQIQNNILKTALIYNFLKYTTWPEHYGPSRDTLTICLLGGDPFSGYLTPLEGRTANSKTIEVKEIQTTDDSSRCNLVFINTNQKSNIESIITFFKAKEMLLISDLAYFTNKGGMVELSMKLDKRVHVYINDKAVAESMLIIDERLSRLAEKEEDK